MEHHVFHFGPISFGKTKNKTPNMPFLLFFFFNIALKAPGGVQFSIATLLG